MKIRHLTSLALALLFAGAVSAQMIQRNWNGTGLVYANTSGVTEIGTAPIGTFTFIAPVFSGHPVIEGVTPTGATGTGKLVFDTLPVLNPASVTIGSGALQHFYNNQSTATQTPSATVRTYITGSNIAITAAQIQVGTIIRWHFDMTKTGAGSASSTFDICFGTAGTTADTAQVSFTKPAGTAAADEGWVDIECIVKTNSSSGVVVGEFRMIHNLAATGHAQIPCVVVNTTSSTFNTLTVTNIGLCITSGSSDAITINQVSAEALNL